MSGAIPINREASTRPPMRSEPRRGQRSSGGNPGGGKNTRRDDPRRGARPSEQRGQQPRQAPNRPPSGAKRGVPGPGMPENPYDVPMEERMKLYREKYGRALGENEAKNGQRKGQRAGSRAGRGGPNDDHHSPAQGKPADRGPSRVGNVKGENARSAQNQRHNRPTQALGNTRSPQASQPKPEQKPEGFMSRIFGGLRKKKE